MQRRDQTTNSSGKSKRPAFIGYLMIGMWFLLTVLSSTTVRAEDAAMRLTAKDILPDIEAALTERGMPGGAEIELNAPDQPFTVIGDVAIGHVSYNTASGRFVVRLANAPVAIAGAATVTQSFPVLNRAIDRGEIIQPEDITMIDSAAIRAGQYIASAGELAGMEARRPLAANLPLRTTDVAAPILIKKGAMVTVTYLTAGLRLTHQGVAMKAGAEGDVIAIQNIQSDRTLKGVVAGHNLVRISSPQAPLHTIEG